MKKISLLSLAIAAATLTACGGDNSPDKPNLCNDLSVERCDQVIAPDTSSGSSSSSGDGEPPANAHLPFTETFNSTDAGSVFNATYKPLLSTVAEDLNPAFLYPASGLAEGRLAVKNNRFTMGNARFTIGQGYDVTGSHIDPAAIPTDPKVNTTRAAGDPQLPMRDSWGELDLRQQWKMSFCVENWEHTGSTANNQLLQVYVDNNSSGKGNSIHGNSSLIVESNVEKFTRGKRVEIMVPGQILSGGVMVDEIFTNPGRQNSFLQVRVPSAASLTMSNFWMGYQSDTSTEPSADSCAPGENVDTFNKPLPPVAPLTAELFSASNSLRVTWPAAPRATTYSVSMSTSDDITTATEVATAITEATYTIGDLTNGTTYYVWIKAANDQGASEWSTSFSGVPDVPAAAPNAVTGAVGYADDRRALLVWDANEAAVNYTVYQNTENSFVGATALTDLTETYYRIKNLSNDMHYYYFITAKNIIGESPAVMIDVTPRKSASNIYEANFDVSQAQFFDSATSISFAATPSVQTISIDNDQAMALAMAGESRMVMTPNGLRVANGRFTLGLAGVAKEDGSYSFAATAEKIEPVGGTWDLSKNYQICYTVVEKHTAGMFRVYVDNTSTTAVNSIHGSSSRLLNQSIAAIPLGEEQCVDIKDDKHFGTPNSFILLNADGNGGEVGVVLSSFKIVDLGTTPIKTEPPASSSSSESSAVSSAPSSSSESSVSSESSSSAPTSSAPSSESSAPSSETSSSGSSSSVANIFAPATGQIAFDSAELAAAGLFKADFSATANNEIVASMTTPINVGGILYFNNSTSVPIRYRTSENTSNSTGVNVWNTNGSSFTSSSTLLSSTETSLVGKNLRSYIAVVVEPGIAATVDVGFIQTGSAPAGTINLVGFDGTDQVLLASASAGDAAALAGTRLAATLASNHTYTQVRILYSRNGDSGGGVNYFSITKN